MSQTPGSTSAVSSQDFRSRTSVYGRQGTQAPASSSKQTGSTTTDVFKDRNRLTLAQVVAHLFEKAVNVQYHDFQGKLSPAMKEFFFTTEEERERAKKGGTGAEGEHQLDRDASLAKFW